MDEDREDQVDKGITCPVCGREGVRVHRRTGIPRHRCAEGADWCSLVGRRALTDDEVEAERRRTEGPTEDERRECEIARMEAVATSPDDGVSLETRAHYVVAAAHLVPRPVEVYAVVPVDVAGGLHRYLALTSEHRERCDHARLPSDVMLPGEWVVETALRVLRDHAAASPVGVLRFAGAFLHTVDGLQRTAVVMVASRAWNRPMPSPQRGDVCAVGVVDLLSCARRPEVVARVFGLVKNPWDTNPWVRNPDAIEAAYRDPATVRR